MMNLAQFKLTSGHEIVCDVIEWCDEGDTEIIARNVMQIVAGQISDNESVFMFRPWINFIENNDEYVLINTNHIVSTNRPNKCLITEYKYAVDDMHMIAIERAAEYDLIEAEAEEELNSSDRIKKSMKKALDNTTPRSNVISFPKFSKRDDSIHEDI